MAHGQSVGIWGPNLKIKNVITGWTLNNFEILKTSVWGLELFMQFYKLRTVPGSKITIS